jgi:mono/diheme cytochrome c family protein
MKRVILLGLALLSSPACAASHSSQPAAGGPAMSRAQQHGRVLFHKFCHQCHPNGETGLGPGINGNPAPMVAFRAQVRGGLGAMPAFPDAIIPDRELDDLLAFVDFQRDHEDDAR